MYKVLFLLVSLSAFQNVVGSQGLHQRQHAKRDMSEITDEQLEMLKDPRVRKIYNFAHSEGLASGRADAKREREEIYRAGYQMALYDYRVKDCCLGSCACLLGCLCTWKVRDYVSATCPETPCLPCNCTANNTQTRVKAPKSAAM